MYQSGNNKSADTPSGTGPSQTQVHMEDDNLFDLKPNVPVSQHLSELYFIKSLNICNLENKITMYLI